MRTSEVQDDVDRWVPPALPHLVVRQRGEHWLCLNPVVPAWFVTNRAGALVVRLADGVRTVSDIHRLLVASGVAMPLGPVMELFAAARQSLIFEQGADREGADDWGARRLTAVHLHLTNRCNLECTYCFRESTPRLPVHLTADHFAEALRRMAPFAAESLKVTFTGGEPTLFPGFETVVEASTGMGYDNILLTNGTLITADRAAFIARHFSEITISLDGPTEAVHAATRGRGNYGRVLAGIRRLADAGANVRVKVTVSPDNLQHCDQVSEVLPDSVPVQFTPMMPMGRSQETHHDFLDDETFVGLRRGLARVTEGRLSSSYTPGFRTRRCHAGAFNVSIADTGDVYPCHLFHKDRFRLGNIFEQSFDEIFFGERNRAYVDSMDVEANNDVCRSCEVRFLCGGGCKANTLHSMGDYRGVDRYCSYLRTTITDELFHSCGVAVEKVPAAAAAVQADGGKAFLGIPSVPKGGAGPGAARLTTSA
ncbi:radical SAM/SPASM domain-containing protein [Actinacidiphila acididurans]|uniref:Radical SAM protein n=1 Tax=Actinacidiphila acididurans TaxID=2784346 RepID=A0ABS2TLL7_9ACTN|nr:radical SAM protein [Actinacidiphila acididurans]MBM9503135.1 radical SAM protein [Actinacidiphila acididurans]